MTRFTDKVPEEDKKKILDLFYGRNGVKFREVLDTEQIAQRMDNKYTSAQVKSVIYSDIEGDDYEQGN